MHSSDFRAAKKECEFALLGLKGLILKPLSLFPLLYPSVFLRIIQIDNTFGKSKKWVFEPDSFNLSSIFF